MSSSSKEHGNSTPRDQNFEASDTLLTSHDARTALQTVLKYLQQERGSFNTSADELESAITMAEGLITRLEREARGDPGKSDNRA